MSQSEKAMFELLTVTSFDWLDPIRDWANRMRDCSGGHAKKFSLFFSLNFKIYFNEIQFCKTTKPVRNVALSVFGFFFELPRITSAKNSIC